MEENVEEKIRSITEQANQTRKMLLEEYLGHSISMEEAINMEIYNRQNHSCVISKPLV